MLLEIRKVSVYTIRYLQTLKYTKPIQMLENNLNVKDFEFDVPFGNLAGKIWNGDQGNTPILAFHGWMDNCGTFDRLCPLLKKEHPIIAVDMPGHGLSSAPTPGSGIYFTDNMVTIHRVIQHFKFKKVILMGHSMGGGASMLYAGTFPELVEKLIVIDILKPLSVEPNDQPSRTASSLKALLTEESKDSRNAPSYSYKEIVDKVVASYRGSVTEESAKVLLQRGSRMKENGSYVFSHSPLLKVPATLMMDFEQQKSFASNISSDFLMVKADQSPIFSSKESCRSILEAYRKRCNNFRLEIVNGTHHVHLNDPTLVAECINKFLDKLPQSEESLAFSNEYVKANL